MMMIVIVLKVIMVFGGCDVSNDSDNDFYGYGDVDSDAWWWWSDDDDDGDIADKIMDGDDDDDDNHGDDIDHSTVWVVVVPSPEFAMHTAEEAICLCIVIKKGIHWFNSLSDQHNIWRHSSDAVRVQVYEESKFWTDEESSFSLFYNLHCCCYGLWNTKHKDHTSGKCVLRNGWSSGQNTTHAC